jgi:hypothetical protein
VRESRLLPLATGVVAVKPLPANHVTLLGAGEPPTVAVILMLLPKHTGAVAERLMVGKVFILIVVDLVFVQPFAAVTVTV